MGFFWERQRKVKCHASRSRHDSECYLGQPGLFVKDHISVFITILRSHRHLSTYTAAYYCDVFKSLYKKYIKKHYVIFVREFPVKRVFAIGSKACVFLKEYITHTSLSVMWVQRTHINTKKQTWQGFYRFQRTLGKFWEFASKSWFTKLIGIFPPYWMR